MDDARKRDYNLDLIRSISMVFVIMIHTQPKPWGSTWLATNIVQSFLALCNAFFFMMSGYLNLRGSFETPQDYKRYYVKRTGSILVPYLFATFVISVVDMRVSGVPFSVWWLLKHSYKGFMSDNSGIHLWFMYSFLGMALAAPFFAKLFQAMKDWELHLLFGIVCLWQVASIYLSLDIGVDFSYSNWFLSGWVLYFFAGYYIGRVVNENNRNYFYIAGAVGFLVTTVGKQFFAAHYRYSEDFASAYVFFAMAIYIYLKYDLRITQQWLKRLVGFLSKYSFTVYLLHWTVLLWFLPKFIAYGEGYLYYFKMVILTLAVCLLAAVVLDIVLFRPIQKLLGRLL